MELSGQHHLTCLPPTSSTTFFSLFFPQVVSYNSSTTQLLIFISLLFSCFTVLPSLIQSSFSFTLHSSLHLFPSLFFFPFIIILLYFTISLSFIMIPLLHSSHFLHGWLLFLHSSYSFTSLSYFPSLLLYISILSFLRYSFTSLFFFPL